VLQGTLNTESIRGCQAGIKDMVVQPREDKENGSSIYAKGPCCAILNALKKYPYLTKQQQSFCFTFPFCRQISIPDS
jgi:hypothetical protein